MNKGNMELLGGSLAGVMLLSGGAAIVAANHNSTPETATKPTAASDNEFSDTTKTASTEVITLSPAELPTESLVTATDEVTAIPEDLFEDLHECRTWREAEENCRVSLKDLMSGRLVDYAKKVSKPFPEDAFKIGNVSVFPGSFGGAFLFYPSTEGLDKETISWMRQGKYQTNNAVFTDPRSPIGDKLIFWVEGDKTSNLNFDMVAEVVKVKNADGSDGYYTVVLPPQAWIQSGSGYIIEQSGTDQAYDDWLKKMAYQPPLYEAATYKRDGNLWKQQGTMILDIVEDKDGTNKNLMDEWKSTGVIPKELEKRPMLGVDSPSTQYPWTKY